jgi:multimeric flavodoxin WrbA
MKQVSKKIIAINSSNRKGNTYGILESLQNILNRKGIEVEIINLGSYNITSCLGCELCLRKDKCPIEDDVYYIMDKLIESDGVIISSPVYMGNVTGILKTFLDRTCKWFHRPELIGKPALIVSTTASSGLRKTLNYLEEISIHWGLHPVGKIGRTVKSINKDISEKEYEDFIKHLLMDKMYYKPSLKQLIYYQVQKVLALKVLEIDKIYWQKKGWVEKDYYFNCRIGLNKRIISRTFYKFLNSRVKRVK